MISTVKLTIQKHTMLLAGDSVCVALSGGADSVALLLVLYELSAELNFSLSAVHVNHLLRGEESNRDEQFCCDLCARLGVPLQIFREDAAAFSHSLGESVETGARELRYRIFDSLKCGKIATAHNLNDNAETLLFRLARGTGLHGLSGIPAVRGKIIRPLIECTRDEIEVFLAEKNQPFVTDSTNLSDDYARNRIRHRIVPEMKAVHGAFPHCVTRMVQSFAEDEDFLTAEAKKCEKQSLFTLHPAIRKRVIINQLKSHNLKVYTEKIEEIESALLLHKSRVMLENGFFAAFDKGVMRIYKEQTTENPEAVVTEFDKEYPFNGDRIVIISVQSGEIAPVTDIVNKKSTIYYADYDTIQGDIVLRNRLRNDVIKPVNSVHTKELRKILQQKLPPEKRKSSAVLTDENGIIWAEHAGIAERVKPRENTENYLRIEIIYTDITN
ncbi:MAG: tRNA lysidine(34) synthetase TilS [Oscillospiraceae bacterium]|nr:tRNA lysidine(34) synthetase TilS [Oscillospiraceae bacterium]